MVRKMGKVKWFDSEQGYGYIESPDEITYFFLGCNCLDNAKNYASSDFVSFEVYRMGNKDIATNVRKEVETVLISKAKM